jgi:hypothetical protein
VVDTRLAAYRSSVEPIVAAFLAAGIPVVRVDNARSELATFAELGAFVEAVCARKLAALGGREAFRASVFGPRFAAAAAASASSWSSEGALALLESDVAPICLLDETEDECVARYAALRARGSKEDALLNAVRRCNRFERDAYVPVLVDKSVVGFAAVSLVEALGPQLASGRAVELVSWAGAAASTLGRVAIRLAPQSHGTVERTSVVAALVDDLVADGLIPPHALRAEQMDVWPLAGQPGVGRATAQAIGGRPPLRMERAATVYFGVPTFGTHVNGYVADEASGRPVAVWVGKRAMSKATYPGLLDQMVAGGQPTRVGVTENMLKECAEEASLPPDVVALALPTGIVSYCYGARKGLSTKTLYTFDLRMPAGMVPFNADGEVDEFILMPVEEALRSIREQLPLWKPNAALVMIDFALRHGFVDCDSVSYEELARGVRSDAGNLVPVVL